MKTYDKIETVLKIAGKALAPHEFADVTMEEHGLLSNGRYFVGCSESTLGRRLREMRADGRVVSLVPPGKTFKRFLLVPRQEALVQ